MITKTLDLNNIERKIFWILAILLSLALGFYLYSALSLTVAVVDRDNMNRTAHELAVVSGTLEAEYLEESNSVTFAFAQKLGFHEVNAKYTGNPAVKLSMAR